jgi:predicted HTH domain antitoxin
MQKFPKLTTIEKIDIAISRYKKRGYKRIDANSISKIVDMTPQRMGNLLKQSERVNYDKKAGEWIIL